MQGAAGNVHLADPSAPRHIPQASIGGKNNTNITTYDAQTPPFWAGGAGTHTIGGHFLNISYQVGVEGESSWSRGCALGGSAAYGTPPAHASHPAPPWQTMQQVTGALQMHAHVAPVPIFCRRNRSPAGAAP